MIINYDFFPDDEFNVQKEFRTTIRHLLEKLNFKVSDESGDNYDFDIEFNARQGLCEIKFYQSRFTPYDSVLIAAKQLKSKQKYDNKALLLIVNGVFQESFATEIFNSYGVQIWDISILSTLSTNFPDIASRLDFILAKVYGYSIFDLYDYNPQDIDTIIPRFWDKLVKAQKIDLEKLGENIYNEINELDSGAADFMKYEEKGTSLLKFLFANDLQLWSKQQKSDDNLNRYDLICRIDSVNKFWQDLSKDFNSRYLVFEFKNYSDKIKQGQIYTTEKYLYKNALRSISFIISRKGADDNAIKASKGALKEHGKLIINLSDEDLKKMAQLKDNGDSPEIVLMDVIDKFLVELNR